MTTTAKMLPKASYIVDSSNPKTETVSGKTWGQSDPSTNQWMKLIATSPSLDFWMNPEEDVYSDTDGEPL